MLNNSGESGHPCLVPDLRGKAFSLSLFSMMLAVGLSYVAFIMLRYLLSMPILLSFYHEWILNFVECFFSIYGDDHVVFVPVLLGTEKCSSRSIHAALSQAGAELRVLPGGRGDQSPESALPTYMSLQ